MNTADANLSNAEESLTKRTQEFKTAASQASEDLTTSSNLIENNYLGLKDVSAIVLVEIAEIANRFEEQSSALNTVSRLLDETQSNIAISLDDRREVVRGRAYNGEPQPDEDLADPRRCAQLSLKTAGFPCPDPTPYP